MKRQNLMQPKSNWVRHGARGALLLVAISTAGCLGDKSADDYRREVVAEALARIQGIQGQYRGEMLSSEGRESLGFVSLSLNPETQVQKSSDNLKSERQAVVRGNLRFMSKELNANLNFNQGYYDDESGLFEASVPLQTTNSSFGQAVARISGRISNGAFSGMIEVSGYSAYGAELNLVKDASARVTPGISAGRAREVVTVSQSYGGSFEYKGGTLRAKLSLEGKESTSEQLFANLLLPSRDLVATLKLTYPDESSYVVVFNPAHLSYDTDALSGTNTDRFYKNLSCKRSVSGGKTQGWTCRYVATSGTGDITWQVELLPEGGR